MGTALLTPIPASGLVAKGDFAAVYAVWPPVKFGAGETTPFVVVTSSTLVGDTLIYPCDRSGEPLAWEFIAHIPHPNHPAALRVAGYDAETVNAHVR
ncbi:hypothetical protein ACIP5Y_21280 [Nocardia sp. NPDC088792]|uniref:hypothetical protein n=1 Tax=Nocardia sp. NPDC088792 TaxID=3364332 RepID=UPI003818A2A1